MAKVRLFGRASEVAQGQKELKVSGRTLGEAREYLKKTFGGQFTALVFDESGNVRPFINIFVNRKHMSQLQGLNTLLGGQDEVLIVPAIAGG